MAIGNEDKTPLAQSQTKKFVCESDIMTKTNVEGILPKEALDPFTVTSVSCSAHKDTKVTLFCQTCEILVCFKCVSPSRQNTHSPHRDHKYTDLVHAYDIHKKNLQKEIAKYQDTLSMQSNLRQKLHQRLQKLKFEVLRKKTQLSRCARSLRSKVMVNERACQRQLETLVQPAIERTDGMFQEVDYDVVSGSGLMGAAESLQQMSVHNRVPFLKNVCRIMREMEALQYKHYSIGDGDMNDNPPELIRLGSISIDRDHEIRMLHKVLLLATSVPTKPKLLSSWCTVGAHSASIVWKYNKSDVIDKFTIKYRLTETTLVKVLDGDRPKGGCGHVTINKFMSGRVQATLLGLKPDTEYSFDLTAINRCGESESMVACLQTSPVSDNVNQDVYFPTKSSEEKILSRRSKMIWFNMVVILSVLMVLLLFLPQLFPSADPICDKICYGKAWCKTPCWNYIAGIKVVRRDLATGVMRLLPQCLLHYIAPQVKEEPVFKPENRWFEWLDFEL